MGLKIRTKCVQIHFVAVAGICGCHKSVILWIVFSLLQKIPYVGAVSGGIRPGMALYFQGNVPQEAEKYVSVSGVS